MHWTHKVVGKYRYLYIYLARNQALKPRSLYSHLDAAPDHAVETWITQYKAQYGGPVTPDHILFSDDTLNKHLTLYRAYLLGSEKERSPLTVSKQISQIRQYVIPYFLRQDPPLKDPAKWPATAVWLARYLHDRGCKPRLVADINLALTNFWTWLQDEHLAPHGIGLALRSLPGVKSGATPLNYTITPQDLLKWVKGQDRLIQFMALCGYFFSLRPQETFALCPKDFTTRENLECVKVMKRAGLFGGLSVEIKRQLTALGTITPPKAHSIGFVACINKHAAALMVDIVNAEEVVSEQILVGDNRKFYRMWRAAVEGTSLEGTTLKDLRRASIYWLGIHSKLGSNPNGLMKHARHKEFETTQLYLRRPQEEREERVGKLKLKVS